jgi:transaldolase
VQGRVLIYVHKEQQLDQVQRLYPAQRYVMVDDKLRLLAAVKQVLGERVVTVFRARATTPSTRSTTHATRPPTAPSTRSPTCSRSTLARCCARLPGDNTMNANTQALHALGQSLWLDNITRTMLDDGTLARYIAELSVTGLTSNPTIFEHAIGHGDAYDEQIGELAQAGKSGEELFFALAIRDLGRAADLFRPAHDASDGVDGWASLEVSPLLVDDTAGSIEAAARLHAAAARPNLFIKIPGTPAGAKAIEESIFAGVPINVTLLFSREQYVAAAEAYLRAIERRIEAGRDPRVASVASLFVSRWDVAVKDQVPREQQNRLGHRDRPAHLQGVSRSARVAALVRLARAGRTPAAAALGEHGDEGSAGPRHALRRDARGARHDRHHPRQDAARVCRALARSDR